MSLQKYLAFIKTVEYGSLTRAARALNYTQSAVSHMLADLEANWGLTLLERDRSGARITSEGLKLLPLVKEVCEADRILLAEVEELAGLRSGLIRIGTFSSVATHWLPNIISAFRRDCPNVDFEFLLGDYEEIENWVQEGRVDCGFLPLPARGELESVFMAEDRLMAVLPENHRLADRPRFPLKAFLDEPFMLLEKGGQNEITAILDKRGLRPRINLITWDDYAIMALVEKNLGLSILPELILRRAPYKIKARELSKPAFRRIGFVVKNMKKTSPAVRRFMEYLKYRDARPETD